MTDELSALTSQEGLEDHIRLRERGELDADLERNYDPAVLILSGRLRWQRLSTPLPP